MSFSKSKVSRGTTEPEQGNIFGFEGLLNINSLPQSIADNQLVQALNVYGSADGGLTKRRGIAQRGALFSNSVAGLNIYRFYQEVVGGTPQNPTVLKLLGQSGGTLYNVDTATQIGSTNALGVNAQSWSVDRVYDPATAGGTDVMVICTGVGGPYLFDGTTISTPTTWSANAAGARWCKVASGCLFFGGILAQPNLLVQMAIGAPQTFQQSYSASLPLTGLAELGAGSQSGLVFGMTKGVGVSFGVNASTLFIQEIPHEDGVAAGRTMITIGGVVYFLGRFNIYMFDGQNIIPIGDNVRPWIICDPLHADYPMNGNRQLSFSWFYNDLVYFAYDSGSVGYCNTYLVWHIKQKGWTLYTGPRLSGATLLDAPGDAIPTACVVQDATLSQSYNWDVYNGQGVNGHNVDDNGTAIQTNILSKYFRLSGPGTRSRVTGIDSELFIESFNGSIVIGTDYGSVSYNTTLSLQASTNELVWNQGSWDQTLWGGNSTLQYAVDKRQIDDGAGNSPSAYSYAVGIATNDFLPPYQYVGASLEFVNEGRSYE